MDNNQRAFLKMNGLGNDFAIFDARQAPFHLPGEKIAAIGQRDTSIGFDQMIILEPSSKGDTLMRIYNRDGSEAEACGNAARCVAHQLLNELDRDQVQIETLEGVLAGSFNMQGDGIIIDMGRPKFAWDEIPLAEPFADTRRIELQIGPIDAPLLHSPSAVNIGNPHVIFWVDDPDRFDLERLGPLIENHPIFPQRTNVSLAHILSRKHIKARVFERGVGITQCCGTAACAIAAAAIRLEQAEERVTIDLPGGALKIDWRGQNNLTMEGPVALEYTGWLNLDNLTFGRNRPEIRDDGAATR